MARRRTDPEIYMIKRMRLWDYVEKDLKQRDWTKIQIQAVYEAIFNGMDELNLELEYRKPASDKGTTGT